MPHTVPQVPPLASSIDDRLLRTLIDRLPDRIYVKDAQGRYVLDNLAHQRFVGAASIDDVVGKTVFDLFPFDLAQRFNADDESILHTGQPLIDVEEPIVGYNGEPRWVLTSKIPLYNSAGHIEGLVAIGRDITEQRRAEQSLREANAQLSAKQDELLRTLQALQESHQELIDTQMQLIQAEKMAAIGRLAAGVAHEVKNPLAIILSAVDYLGITLTETTPEIHSILSALRHAVERADKAIRDLVDFASSRQIELKPQSVNTVIEQSLLMVHHELNVHHVALATELAPNLPAVSLDATRIEQVFVNILMNAIQAMSTGGNITVRTRSEHIVDPPAARELYHLDRFRAGDRVVIVEFLDTGPGIRPDQLSRVFDAFFTTKPTGQGSGLGLTIAHKIIELHHGAIAIANRPEGGATVTIMFKSVKE